MNKEIITTKIAIFQKKEIRKTIHKNGVNGQNLLVKPCI